MALDQGQRINPESNLRVVSEAHCGATEDRWDSDVATFTTSRHDPTSWLPDHAHSRPHLALVVKGAFFERMGDARYLRLPGDAIVYSNDLVHENRFGRLPVTCLNVEMHDASLPVIDPRPEVPEQLKRAITKATGSKQASLRQVAYEAGYHPAYFSRLFRKSMNTSLGEWFHLARVRKATDLIVASDLALAEIALESGYFDQSHLTHEVKKRTGFTPGEIRRLADR